MLKLRTIVSKSADTLELFDGKGGNVQICRVAGTKLVLSPFGTQKSEHRPFLSRQIHLKKKKSPENLPLGLQRPRLLERIWPFPPRTREQSIYDISKQTNNIYFVHTHESSDLSQVEIQSGPPSCTRRVERVQAC